MIVVTGATGRLGQLVIDGLLQRVPAAQIIAAVRTPEKAAPLAARGVTVRRADYDEPGQLSAAFTGADRMLLISSNDPRRSVAQHTAVIEAARQAGVGQLAYTSLCHADTSTLLTAVPHRLTEPPSEIRASCIPSFATTCTRITTHSRSSRQPSRAYSSAAPTPDAWPARPERTTRRPPSLS